MQVYLEARLKASAPGYVVPEDTAAIACMRLAVMTQAENDLSVIDVFHGLPEVHKKILATELARTGCAGQTFKCNPLHDGPSFLLYYGPALLQRNATSCIDLASALEALSHVFHASRVLWPARRNMQGANVTIQVGQLKSQEMSAIMSCPKGESRSVWILLKLNDLEGSVELHRASYLNELYKKGVRFYVIDFGGSLPEPSDAPEGIAENGTKTSMKGFINGTFEKPCLNLDDDEPVAPSDSIPWKKVPSSIPTSPNSPKRA